MDDEGLRPGAIVTVAAAIMVLGLAIAPVLDFVPSAASGALAGHCESEAKGVTEIGVACPLEGSQDNDGEPTRGSGGEGAAEPPPAVITRYGWICGEDQVDGSCVAPATCFGDVGTGLYLYRIFRSYDGGTSFVAEGEACTTLLPDDTPDDSDDPVITPGVVATAFVKLIWPQSPLQIQPVGGRTLVNLPTNFFTTNTAPTTQGVTLLEQQVEIEATPTTWTWHHGDTTSQSTTVPGTEYPKLTITHTYLRASEGVSPSLDTTYTGRYRVSAGEWIAIPATHTVTGTPGTLEILTARPQLIGSD